MSTHKNAFSRYLPVNAEALLWEIYCVDAGYTLVPPGAAYPPAPRDHPREYAATVTTGRVLREFQIVYITAGSGWFKDEHAARRPVVAGDIFMLFPGVRHAYSSNVETGWQEYWVGFSGEHAHRL
ncbi:MAG: AraC family ligand binding domain-containing protein, partial [Spirochaetia bacterium]